MSELVTVNELHEGTLTIINIGNTDKHRADIIKERLDGKTYMDFQVICAPYMGSYSISVQTMYDAPRDEIIGMLLYIVATELYAITQEQAVSA